ncbi:hypothetical protein AY599_22635 [Leptolyngbya valderiana BDU 20041]|nr:hypothetical protein AY599_22635 [Leptolyngbya valderiana BDU 20041]
MGGMWLLGLIQILFLLVLLALPIVGLWALLSCAGIGFDQVRRAARRARHDASPAVCGVCGHAVGETITGERCGECGTPYLRGGIVTAATTVRLGAPMLLAVVMIMAVCLVVGGISVSIGTAIGNQIAVGSTSIYQYTSNQSFGPWFPGSNAPDYEFYVNADLTGPDRFVSGTPVEPTVEPRTGTLRLGLRGPDANPVSLTYDVGKDAWSIPARGGVPEASGTDVESAVRELYRRGGLDAYWSNSQGELDDAILIANTLAGEGPTAQGVPSFHMALSGNGDGLTPQGGGTGTQSAGLGAMADPAVIIAVIISLIPPLVLFVLALWLLIRIRARALAVARSAQ